MNFKLNLVVTVHGGAPDHGVFVGKIVEIGPNTMVVQPTDPAVALWFPNGYSVGKAHWDSTIEVQG